MAEPAAKKARTEAAGKDEAPIADAEKEAPEAAAENEGDAKADKSPRIKEAPVFHTQDTTINVMQGACASVLLPLTDGGMQYLLAGARANVGLKSGRYMFEAKIVEVMNPADDPASRQRTPMPRSQLRIGFSSTGSSLFLGETEDSIGFDTEGFLLYNKARTPCSQKFGSDIVIAVLLNLDPSTPNANTVSVFKDGVRASAPQPLPDALRGKALHPTFTFKNLVVQYNFGPAPLVPLSFSCRMVQDASVKDSTVLAAPKPPADGRYEVLFPVCLPDEGTFDWLDMFSESHPEYTELSDRAVLAWAERSGLQKLKGFTLRSSNDKPEMGFGVSLLDDQSVRRVIQATAPIQQRHYVVMEVKSNLVREERKELLAKWPASGFKRIACVMVSDPPEAFKKRSQALALKAKQEVADAEFRAKKEEEKKQKMLEKRQRQLERERAKALAKQQRAQEELKRKMEIERKKAEALAAGEEYKEEEEDKDMAAKAKSEEEEQEKEEEEEDDDPMDETPPKVELTAEERRQVFRKFGVPDLTPYALSTSFTRFSVPEKDEGFDEIRFEWASQQKKCKDYLRQWVQERKTTTRVEDLHPGEWFTTKWKDWQKTLQSWHAKQNSWKTAIAKRAQERAARQARRAAAAAAREARAKVVGDTGADADAKAKADGEEADDDEDEERVDFDKLDVFGVEDILNIGGGEPLFSAFGFEDWTMMSLRFELHLIAHAFKRDVNDPDRMGIHVEHLGFYYNKYYKKALNHKFYGVDTMQELLDLTKDTVVITRKGKVVEPQLPDDMESLGIFVMLTEEARRDRARRVDLGDESARLKLSQPHVPAPGAAVAVVAAAMRPPMAAGPRPAPVQLPAQVVQARPPGVAPVWQPMQQMRPPIAAPQPRGFPQQWSPRAAWSPRG